MCLESSQVCSGDGYYRKKRDGGILTLMSLQLRWYKAQDFVSTKPFKFRIHYSAKMQDAMKQKI